MASPEFEQFGPLHYLIDLPIRALFFLLRLLPHKTSLNVAASFANSILVPLFGVNRRIYHNLDHIAADFSVENRAALAREANANATKLMVESFNVAGFLHHARKAQMGGSGVASLLEALENKRPVILVSGHFGNYQVPRVLLSELGHDTAAIYRPMNNGYTNRRYVAAMNRLARPNFSRGMKGTKALLTQLKNGGAIAMLNDQAANEGKIMPFLGKPATTMLSAAEFALKFNALLVPFYGIRCPDGVNFEVIFEDPIPHSDAETMTGAINASLEAQIRARPGQWFWAHKRWKFV